MIETEAAGSTQMGHFVRHKLYDLTASDSRSNRYCCVKPVKKLRGHLKNSLLCRVCELLLHQIQTALQNMTF